MLCELCGLCVKRIGDVVCCRRGWGHLLLQPSALLRANRLTQTARLTISARARCVLLCDGLVLAVDRTDPEFLNTKIPKGAKVWALTL